MAESGLAGGAPSGDSGGGRACPGHGGDIVADTLPFAKIAVDIFWGESGDFF